MIRSLCLLSIFPNSHCPLTAGFSPSARNLGNTPRSEYFHLLTHDWRTALLTLQVQCWNLLWVCLQGITSICWQGKASSHWSRLPCLVLKALKASENCDFDIKKHCAPCLDTPLLYRHYTAPFLTPIVHSSGGHVLTALQTAFLSSQTILFVFHQKQQPKAMGAVGISCSVWKHHLQYFSVQASQTI